MDILTFDGDLALGLDLPLAVDGPQRVFSLVFGEHLLDGQRGDAVLVLQVYDLELGFLLKSL